jgi:hypothetical protein
MMSHPDPCYDPDNSYEDDEMSTDTNYDDYNDFYGENLDYDDYDNETDDDLYDDSMDGDHDSAMESAGWGTDEDYGYYGEDTPMYDDYYGGE